jgi:hypothetical protein
MSDKRRCTQCNIEKDLNQSTSSQKRHPKKCHECRIEAANKGSRGTNRNKRVRIIYDYSDFIEQGLDISKIIHDPLYSLYDSCVSDNNVEAFMGMVIGSDNIITMYIQYTNKRLLSSVKNDLIKCGFKSDGLKVAKSNISLDTFTIQTIKIAFTVSELPMSYYRQDLYDEIKSSVITIPSGLTYQ